jgi:hypothetical protein
MVWLTEWLTEWDLVWSQFCRSNLFSQTDIRFGNWIFPSLVTVEEMWRRLRFEEMFVGH